MLENIKVFVLGSTPGPYVYQNDFTKNIIKYFLEEKLNIF